MTEPATPLDRLLILRASEQANPDPAGTLVLADLLTRLQLPASLLGGRHVAISAIQLLRTSIPALELKDQPTVHQYIDELQWMLRFTYRSPSDIFQGEAEHESFRCRDGRNPYLQSGAGDHGLCCLLMASFDKSSSDFKRLQPHFDVFRSIALLAHLAALGHWASQADWPSPDGPGARVRESMYRRTLSIRHFVMARYRAIAAYRDTLEQIPLHRSLAELRKRLREIRRGLPVYCAKPETQLDADLASILGLLRVIDHPDSLRAYEHDEVEDATDETPYKVEFHEQVEDFEQEEEDDEDEEGATCELTAWQEQEKKSCLDAGLNPADTLPIERLHLSSRRNGNAQASQAMRNQHLSLDPRNLAPEELGLALQILESQVERDVSFLEIRALVKSTVARGLTLERAQALEVRSDRPKEVTTLTFLLSPGDIRQSEWLIPAVPIPFAQEHGTYPGCRRTVKDFVSPDYWRVGELLRKLIGIKFPGWQGEPVRPFEAPIEMRRTPATYPQRLKAAIELADPDRGPGLARRATFGRLGRALAQKIYDQTEDLVPVTYATLRKERTGEDGRFYATPAVSSVQRAEHAAVRSIQNDFLAMGYNASMDLTLVPSDSSGYLGSPMCLTLDALGGFLQKQIETIVAQNEILRQAPDDIKAIIARHNAHTMLTFCAVSTGTCHRPTHSMVPDVGTIDPATGHFSTADKGLSKARFGVIADAAFAQRKSYHDYVNSFDFAKYFSDQTIPQGRLFFIDENSSYIDVTRSSLEQHRLPFVANFARHLAKTVFSEWCAAARGNLTQEWIAALLGHFMEGEEPFGPCSSFNYKRFAESMRAALKDLLAKLQFEPIDISGEEVPVHGPEIRRLLGSIAA